MKAARGTLIGALICLCVIGASGYAAREAWPRATVLGQTWQRKSEVAFCEVFVRPDGHPTHRMDGGAAAAITYRFTIGYGDFIEIPYVGRAPLTWSAVLDRQLDSWRLDPSLERDAEQRTWDHLLEDADFRRRTSDKSKRLMALAHDGASGVYWPTAWSLIFGSASLVAAFLLAFIVTRRVAQHARARIRRRRNNCVACGYNVGTTGSICPECGEIPPQT